MKYILMSSDGYEIEYSFYPDLESAQNAMKEAYHKAEPDEWIEEFEDLSNMTDVSAILYNNGEDVYVWQIGEIPTEEGTDRCADCYYCLTDKTGQCRCTEKNFEESVVVKPDYYCDRFTARSQKECCTCQYCFHPYRNGQYWCTRDVDNGVLVNPHDSCFAYRG